MKAVSVDGIVIEYWKIDLNNADSYKIKFKVGRKVSVSKVVKTILTKAF